MHSNSTEKHRPRGNSIYAGFDVTVSYELGHVFAELDKRGIVMHGTTLHFLKIDAICDNTTFHSFKHTKPATLIPYRVSIYVWLSIKNPVKYAMCLIWVTF